MPTLQDRFADLAEDAPQSPTPPGIWTEGRRRARVRRGGTALVVAATLVALGSVGGVSAYRSSEPGPADQSGSPVGLPTEIHHPSPWLSGTGDQPPGRLSMVIPAKRGGWPHYHWGTVGVSATTGAYHYLDIPGCFEVEGLSPDGRQVSCFTSAGPAGHEVLEGLLVYDTGTGHVDRWTPTTGKLDPNTVAWSGSDAMTFRVGHASYLWKFGRGAPRPSAADFAQPVGVAGGDGVYRSGANSFFYLDDAQGRQRVDLRLAYHFARFDDLAVSPSGTMVAVVHPSDRQSRLLAGTVEQSGRRTRVHVVPAALQWPTIVGWADDQHLLVVSQVSPVGRDGSAEADRSYALDRVDVTTGKVARLAGMADQGDSWVTFASSMLDAPTRDFPAPPQPMNQRVELGLGVGIVLLGGLVLVVWRRRVRS